MTWLKISCRILKYKWKISQDLKAIIRVLKTFVTLTINIICKYELILTIWLSQFPIFITINGYFTIKLRSIEYLTNILHDSIDKSFKSCVSWTYQWFEV